MKKKVICSAIVLGMEAGALLMRNYAGNRKDAAQFSSTSLPAVSADVSAVVVQSEDNTEQQDSIDYIDYGDGMMIAMDYLCDAAGQRNPCSQPEWRYELNDNGMLRYFANEDKTQFMTFYEDGTRKMYMVMHARGNDAVAFDEDGRVTDYQREKENWKTKADGNKVLYGTAELVDQASAEKVEDFANGILITETYDGSCLKHVLVNDHGTVSEYDISYDEIGIRPGAEEFERKFYYPVNAVMPERNREGKLKTIINPFHRTTVTFHYTDE